MRKFRGFPRRVRISNSRLFKNFPKLENKKAKPFLTFPSQLHKFWNQPTPLRHQNSEFRIQIQKAPTLYKFQNSHPANLLKTPPPITIPPYFLTVLSLSLICGFPPILTHTSFSQIYSMASSSALRDPTRHFAYNRKQKSLGLLCTKYILSPHSLLFLSFLRLSRYPFFTIHFDLMRMVQFFEHVQSRWNSLDRTWWCGCKIRFFNFLLCYSDKFIIFWIALPFWLELINSSVRL